MTGFPIMAGKPDIDDALASELEAAGIEVFRLFALKNGRREVNTEVRGGLHGWSFERAWYYWRCSGPGIEVAAAERLHAAHGKDVRVAGHCGCPSPTEWYKGLAVGDYHVDTPAGLKALADTIKALVDQAKSPSDPSSTRSDVTALADIAKERRRQRDVEGWTVAHDDGHDAGEMASAAACYALSATGIRGDDGAMLRFWPWDDHWWKPTNCRRDLIKAGALIVAEIERLDRLDQFEIRRK